MSNKIFVPKDVLKRKIKNKRQTLPENIFAGNEKHIPDRVIIYYSDKIKLSQIDAAIIFKFNNMKKNIDTLVREIDDLEKEKINITIHSDIYFFEDKIKKKINLIKDLEKEKSLSEYKEKTEKILKYYEENPDIEIAEKYLEIANNYIHIEKLKILEYNFNCKGCKYDLNKVTEDKEGFYICPECNAVNNSLKPNKYIKDLDNFNNNYEEDINNFIKILDKFEGKNTVIIHNELYNELDNYFLSRDMEKGEYYRNLCLLKNGKKEGTSRKKLWTALEYLGYNQYYDETSYISHIYWGWEIPDLTLFRDQILKDYQNTQQIWSQIKSDYKRSASLGTQFRLYVHLMAVGYPHCERDDFKIQDMVESLRLHNNAWKRMCIETNINYFEVS